MAGEVTSGLRTLLANQVCFQVEDWGPSSERPSTGEREQGDLAVAHVVSSAVQEHWMVEKPKPEQPAPRPGDALGVTGKPLSWDALLASDFLGFVEYEETKHIVILDIDHPSHLVDSSTPGHHHLYVEIPPCPWSDYVEFLKAAEKIGLCEPGYVTASIERGHSDVRLPWVRKGEPGDLPTPGGIVSKVAEPVAPPVPVENLGGLF
jgi:hypothetical protein